MSRSLPIAIAVVIASAAGHRAIAQERGAPIVVELRAPQQIDGARLREALEDDLGTEVRIVTEPSGAQVIVELDEHVVRIRVRRGDRDALAREIERHPDREHAALGVALVVANLVRDEASAILALLHVEQSPAPELVTVEPGELDDGADRTEEPPVATEDSGEPEVDGDDDAEGELEAPQDMIDPDEPEDTIEPEHVPFAIDFAPGLGFSTALLGRERRTISLGVIGDLSLRIEGASLSSVLSITADGISGLGAAGVLSVNGGETEGAQLAGVIAITGGDFEGLQLAPVVSVTGGALKGAQLAVIGVVGGALEGAQLGVIDIAGARVDGAQLGVVTVASGGVHGAQLGW